MCVDERTNKEAFSTVFKGQFMKNCYDLPFSKRTGEISESLLKTFLLYLR